MSFPRAAAGNILGRTAWPVASGATRARPITCCRSWAGRWPGCRRHHVGRFLAVCGPKKRIRRGLRGSRGPPDAAESVSRCVEPATCPPFTLRSRSHPKGWSGRPGAGTVDQPMRQPRAMRRFRPAAAVRMVWLALVVVMTLLGCCPPGLGGRDVVPRGARSGACRLVRFDRITR